MKEEEEENLLHGADSAEDCSRRSYGTQAEAPSPPSPFPVDVDLNQKLYLFHGDMCSLRVDALVCFTNENFGSVDDLGRRLRASAFFFLSLHTLLLPVFSFPRRPLSRAVSVLPLLHVYVHCIHGSRRSLSSLVHP